MNADLIKTNTVSEEAKEWVSQLVSALWPIGLNGYNKFAKVDLCFSSNKLTK